MKTILQVEDDPNDVLFLEYAMKKMGVANPIQVASDGQEAIDYLQGTGKFQDRARFPYPSLVLLDLQLPYVKGLEVLSWIRKQPGPILPVIILSASGLDSDITTAYRLGANAFLTKPSEARTLEAMVKAIADFWLTHNIPSRAFSPAASIGGVLGPVHEARGGSGEPHYRRPPRIEGTSSFGA